MSERPTPEQILLTHHIECTGPGEVSCRGCRDAGWMTWTGYYRHLLDALTDHGYAVVDAERFAWLERVEEAASEMPIDLDDWIGADQ